MKDPEDMTDDDPQGPAHEPLASDHVTLWLDVDTGESALYAPERYR